MESSVVRLSDVTDLKRISKYREVTIYSGTNQNNNVRVAIKVFNSIENLTLDTRIPALLESLEKDEGRHISPILGYEKVTTRDGVSQDDLYNFCVISPLYTASLEEYIRKSTRPTIDEAEKILRVLVEGLKELQEIGISHKNLKPGNIFFLNDIQQVKFADFGELDLIVYPTLLSAYDNSYKIKYMSPEIRVFLSQWIEALLGTREWRDVKDYDPFKSDTFSLGLVLLEIFAQENIEYCFVKGRKGSFIDHEYVLHLLDTVRANYGERLFLLLGAMLIPDPKDRIDFMKLSALLPLEMEDLQKELNDNKFVNPIIGRRGSTAFQANPAAETGIINTTLQKLRIADHDTGSIINIEEEIRMPIQRYEGWKNTRHYLDILSAHQDIHALKLNLSNSTLLFLLNKDLNFNDIKYLGQHLAKMVNLVFLDLSVWAQTMGDEGLQQLACSFLYLGKLKHLRLKCGINYITDVGFLQLGDCLQYLTDLESLTMNFLENMITQTGMNKFAELILKLPNLKILNICVVNNKLDAQPCRHLSEKLKASREWREFNFRY